MHYRWGEYLLLFWGGPLLLFAFRNQLALAIVPILLLTAGGCSLVLWRDGILQRQWRQARQLRLAAIRPLLRLLLAGAVLLLGLMVFFLPEQIFQQPRYWTSGWLLLLLLYPLCSALPQELIFRTFFFHRYQSLFPGPLGCWLMSSCGFSLAHAIYGNWIAVLLSFLGGLLFGYRFQTTDSTALVTIEHSLWGLLVFSSGLGTYFIGVDAAPGMLAR